MARPSQLPSGDLHCCWSATLKVSPVTPAAVAIDGACDKKERKTKRNVPGQMAGTFQIGIEESGLVSLI